MLRGYQSLVLFAHCPKRHLGRCVLALRYPKTLLWLDTPDMNRKRLTMNVFWSGYFICAILNYLFVNEQWF